MASVKSISFTCPNCAKVLRASARPPAGKKIKCPACEHTFVPELDEEEAATSIQDKPRVKAKAARARDDDEEEKPRNKKSRADEDDDDRPSRKKKSKKKKSGSKMMMILLGLFFVGGGGLLGCGGCGAAVWFMYFKSPAAPDMLAFVSPEANLLIGGKPKELKTKFAGFKDMFAQGAPVAGAQDRFPEMEDLMVNSDQFLMFMNTNKLMNVAMMGAPKSTGMVMVIKAETAEIERLKKSNRLDAGKSVGGHSIHRVKNNRPGVKGTGPELLAFTDKLVLLTDLDEAQFVTVLDRGKKSPAKSDAIDLSRSVNRSPMWLAFTFDGETRKKLREAIEMGAQKVPAMQAAGPAFDGAKGVTLTTDVVGVNDLKLTASVMCKNAADAGKVKTGLEEGWKMVKGAIDGLMMFGGAPKGPEAKAMELLMRDLGKMSFSTSGDIASATLTFGNDTIDELAKGVKNNPFGPFGGMGPQPRPRFDGGPIVAPKGPTIFSAPNFIAGQLKDRQFQFEKGTRLRLDVHCGSQTGAVVEVAILEGAAGNKVVFTNNQKGAVRQVNFTVPATGTYRVRMRNLGPGVVPNATVFVFENP